MNNKDTVNECVNKMKAELEHKKAQLNELVDSDLLNIVEIEVYT